MSEKDAHSDVARPAGRTYVEHIVGGVSTTICEQCAAPILTTEAAHERAHLRAEHAAGGELVGAPDTDEQLGAT